MNSSHSFFKDKVIIVTGAASGIGKALSEALAQQGAILIVTDINKVGCQQVAWEIVNQGGRAQGYYLDVSQAETFQTLIDQVVADYGQLDYLFNNAGMAIAGETYNLSLEHWRRLVDVNFWGVVYGTKMAYEVMVKQGFGHIVNIASLGGLIESPMLTPYAATKHAIVGLSTSLRIEAEDLGVKVSVVCPYYVQTSIYDTAVIVGIDKEHLISELPFKMLSVAEAAKLTLRGVQRNQGIIVFPALAKLWWWVYRLHPGLLAPLVSRTLARGFRSLAVEEKQPQVKKQSVQHNRR